jgi:outer membrane PBP1 activator LpoA protein
MHIRLVRRNSLYLSPAVRHIQDEGWLTLAEAAGQEGLQPDTLRQQIKAGKLRAVKRAGAWFTRKGWVEQYKEEHPHPARQAARRVR